jgi:hypothetical protein
MTGACPEGRRRSAQIGVIAKFPEMPRNLEQVWPNMAG